MPDLPPSLTLEAFSDTASLTYLGLGGTVRDDYGLTRLALHYTIRRAGSQSKLLTHNSKLLTLPREAAGTYAYTWNLAPLALRPGDRVEYFVEAWDNDGLHGPKSTRTRPAEFRLPGRDELRRQLKTEASAVASQMSQAAKQSQQLEQARHELPGPQTAGKHAGTEKPARPASAADAENV